VRVAITNTSRRGLVFVLDHDVYCAELGRCACRSGAHRVASSLTIASGLTVSVDDAVLSVPELVRAVRDGSLSVKRGAA
jgi:hypothetical protein